MKNLQSVYDLAYNALKLEFHFEPYDEKCEIGSVCLCTKILQKLQMVIKTVLLFISKFMEKNKIQLQDRVFLTDNAKKWSVNFDDFAVNVTDLNESLDLSVRCFFAFF